MYSVSQIKSLFIMLICFIIVPASIVYWFDYAKTSELIDAKHFNSIFTGIGLMSGILGKYLISKCGNHISENKRSIVFSSEKWFILYIFVQFLFGLLVSSIIVTIIFIS